MGCNSHLVIETCQEYAGRGNTPQRNWYVWGKNIQESRDYVLYGLMAGVRNEFKQSFKDRGLPPDAAWDTKVFFGFKDDDGNDVPEGNSDFHSFSWLTPLEFYKVCVDYENVCHDDGDHLPRLSKNWAALAEILLVLSKHFGSNNVRLVFAFDN